MNVHHRTVVLNLLLLVSLRLAAQVPSIYHIGRKDGLPNAIVYRVCQDARGYLWIATENGLGRYDGHEIRTYRTENGLPGNTIIHVDQDMENRLWLYSYGYGPCLFQNDTITHFDSQYRWSSVSVQGVHLTKGDWVSAKGGRLFFGNDTMSIQILPKEGSGIQCKRVDKFDSSTVCVLLSTGQVWFYRNTPLNRIKTPDRLKGFTFRHITTDGKGRLVGFTDREIISYESGKVERLYQSSGDSIVTDVAFIDSKQNIWYATNGTVKRLDCHGVMHDLSSIFDQHTIVNQIYEDKAGNIWLPSYGAGLYCVRMNGVLNLKPGKGAIHTPVYDIAPGDKDSGVVVASAGLISKVIGGDAVRLWEYPLNTYSYFVRDFSDTIFVGQSTGMIRLTETRDGTVRAVSYPNRQGIISTCTDKNGVRWVGHYKGMSKFLNGSYLPLDNPAMRDRRIEYLHCGKVTGRLYVVTDSGAYYLDGTKAVPLMVPERKYELAIYKLLEDRNGHCWIATHKGIFFSKNTSGRPRFEKLLSESVHQLCELRNGMMLAGGYNGGVIFNGTNIFTRITESDGLYSNFLRTIAQDHGGRIWFGTDDGVSIVTEDWLTGPKDGKAIGKIFSHIREVHMDSSIYVSPKHVVVPPGTKALQFIVSGIQLPSSRSLKHEYRITGLDTQWRTLSGHTLQLSGLIPGNYRLQLRARGKNGSLSELSSLDITVEPAYHQTSWFRWLIGVLGVVLVTLTVIFVRKEALRNQRARHQQRLKRLYARLGTIQQLIPPHFVFNSMNSLLSLVRQDRRTEAQKYITMLSRLLRANLKHATSVFIPLNRELEKLNAYLSLEQMRLSEKFEYTIRVSNEINQAQAYLPNMLLQPFVENAIKHGITPVLDQRKGVVEIVVRKELDKLIIHIDDNGIGFKQKPSADEDEHSTSLGLSFGAKTVKLMNELIAPGHSINVLKPDNGQGTRIEIVMPFKGSTSSTDSTK